MDGVLPAWTRPLGVIAHPDDESFGLGALHSAFVDAGGDVAVLCFTRGEASTLQAVEGNLATIRAAELEAAAEQLGVTTVELLDEPDGLLDVADRGRRVASVLAAAVRHRTDGLLVFDDTGITGHPDHIAATGAALEAARSAGLPVRSPWTPAARDRRHRGRSAGTSTPPARRASSRSARHGWADGCTRTAESADGGRAWSLMHVSLAEARDAQSESCGSRSAVRVTLPQRLPPARCAGAG
jgi:LmbE family N-acetylglucosaminyl deacetylase